MVPDPTQQREEKFDPDELVRWAESYGHPEEWAKKAQALHGRVEAAEAEVERLKQALTDIEGWENWQQRPPREIARSALSGGVLREDQ